MEDIFVLCVNRESIHTLTSQLTHCCKCKTEVWMSIHNLDKKPICLKCITEIAKTQKINPIIAPQDLLEAIEFLEKRGKKKGE